MSALGNVERRRGREVDGQSNTIHFLWALSGGQWNACQWGK